MEKIQRIKCGNGNCYIVSNGENAVLVDTCREKYRDKILNACKPYNIRLLILTHGHLDHVQNAAYLAKELNVPIAMSRADVELINNNVAQALEAESFLGKIVLAVSIKSLSTEKFTQFTPDIFLGEGDTLESYGINADILDLPGHTDGSIAVDVGGKHLIVGDALMNMFYPTVSMLYHDKAVMLKSAERIGGLGERIIYFGHGKPLSNRAWVRRRGGEQVMTRNQILQYAKEKYGTVSEHLWLKYPDYEVLRHEGGGKWYGIIMDVTRKKIGLEGDGEIDILVLKGKPDDVVHICDMKGFAPAYHMNKKHWFTVILDEVEDSIICGMIDGSYELTE